MKTLILGAAVLLTAGLAADLSLIQPNEAAAQLASKARRTVVFQIGPNVLYRSKHIPGAVYAGPASRPEGLALLKTALDKLPRDSQVVVYCGCCPWDHCPNVKPASELLKQMGFTHAKILYLETGFAKDWIEKGYPVESGTAAQ
ncbi:MAG TPA: rhodanese-like domain-containing protein [Bryobacteraceae bacterium]|nr:rhodanese-like domain-containing protein [Bryobacteraceae bacterium]